MKSYLLDTHTTIWSLTDDESKLSRKAKSIISDTSNPLCVSIASLWEISIKVSTGKANFDGNINAFHSLLCDNGIELIGIYPTHLGIVETLPFIHRDPFDRVIIATAKIEKMTIITADKNIQKYDIPWIW